MEAINLKDILEKHAKWFKHMDGGQCANLRNANLRNADLRNADLRNADLRNADLRNADLRNANLRKVDLNGADLWGANLSGADLRDANLSGADLRKVDLNGADLWGANLSGADLWTADLRTADLRNADLRNANLRGANLWGASLLGADIDNKLLSKWYPIACPEVGSFIAWKACMNNTIVKLQILDDAQRSSAFTRKCRCSAAKVLAIENADGTVFDGDFTSSVYDPAFIYKIGEIVKVNNFDPDRKHECAPGIHFFLTRQEAVDWSEFY